MTFDSFFSIYFSLSVPTRSARDRGLPKSLGWWRSDRPWPWYWPSRTTTPSSTCSCAIAWLTMENEHPSSWWTRRVAWPAASSCPDSPRSRTLVQARPCCRMRTSRHSSFLTRWKFTSSVPYRFAGTSARTSVQTQTPYSVHSTVTCYPPTIRRCRVPLSTVHRPRPWTYMHASVRLIPGTRGASAQDFTAGRPPPALPLEPALPPPLNRKPWASTVSSRWCPQAI